MLEIINEQEVLGKEFRIYGTFEEPLFLAKDVAEWIDYDVSSLNKMLRNVDEDEKVRNNVPTPGGVQEMWFLTEDGLNEVLMQSRKPIAKQYKKKVKAILKEIRKTGVYVSPDVKPVDSNAQVNILIQQNAKMMENMMNIVKSVTDANERVVATLEKMVGNFIKPAPNEETIDARIDEIAKKQESQEIALLAMQNRKPPADSKTLAQIAERLNFYVDKTGRPNSALVADILRNELGISTKAEWGRDDKDAITCITVQEGEAKPCLWIKRNALVKLQFAIDNGQVKKAVQSKFYQRTHGDHKAGDWMFDFVQYAGARRHIIANDEGERVKWA